MLVFLRKYQMKYKKNILEEIIMQTYLWYYLEILNVYKDR